MVDHGIKTLSHGIFRWSKNPSRKEKLRTLEACSWLECGDWVNMVKIPGVLEVLPYGQDSNVNIACNFSDTSVPSCGYCRSRPF